MADCNSIREHFNNLASIYDSLESLFTLSYDEHPALVIASKPALERFQQELDALDPLIQPD